MIIAAGLTTLGYAIAHRDRAYAPSSPVAAGLQGGASGPLGGYSAHLVAGGFRAANPAQGLSTFFGPSGVTVGAGALRVNVTFVRLATVRCSCRPGMPTPRRGRTASLIGGAG